MGMYRALKENDCGHSQLLSTPEELIEDARQGRMCILVDDREQENQGQLFIPADFATPDAINFMARYACGLIRLAMTEDRAKQLGLTMMNSSNLLARKTAFTVTIEAREGVSTGISAADRAHTIRVAIDPSKGADDIVSPGHIFPLLARPGGVLARAGHTEAAVDLATLAGVDPSGVICEIMNNDGTVARLSDLATFAQDHGMKIGTIADLIACRRRKETLVELVEKKTFNSDFGGEWELRLYRNKIEGTEHIVLVKGNVPSRSRGAALVRMHSMRLSEYLGEINAVDSRLQSAMIEIAREGSGAIVIMRLSESQGISDLFGTSGAAHKLHDERVSREYGLGAQILVELGIRDVILMTNSPHHRLIGLEGYDLHIVEERPF